MTVDQTTFLEVKNNEIDSFWLFPITSVHVWRVTFLDYLKFEFIRLTLGFPSVFYGISVGIFASNAPSIHV